ncbi:TBC domain-containing protein [Ceratocystis lukuohia]
MAPSKLGSIRSRTRPSGLSSPFKDDSIVTFRYEHTVASTPPIPVGPTKPLPPICVPHSQSQGLSQSHPPLRSAPLSSSSPPSDLPRKTLVRSSSCSSFAHVSASAISVTTDSTTPTSPTPCDLQRAVPISRSQSVATVNLPPSLTEPPPIYPKSAKRLLRAHSSSAVPSIPSHSSCRPPSSISALRRKSSSLAAAVAATRNPPPPPPVEAHPLFRNSAPNLPVSSAPLGSLIASNRGSEPSDRTTGYPSSPIGLYQNSSIRSASTRASSIDCDSFWTRSSSLAGTTCSSSTIYEGSIDDQDCRIFSSSHNLQKRPPSRKREYALISKSVGRRPTALAPTFSLPTFDPASVAVSPTEPPSPLSKPVTRNVSSAASSRSVSPTFGPLPCSALPLHVVHETQAPSDISFAAMPPPPPPHYKSLDAATNSIVVDSRLSFDLGSSQGNGALPRHIPETPLPLPNHVAPSIRAGAVSPAISEVSSCYSTAPSQTMSSASGSGSASDKRPRLGSAFGLRSMSSVRNRFRRRSPTDVTPVRQHESAMASVTSSVGRFSLSASRTSDTTGSDAMTATTTPMHSSFLGVSRLSLLAGGSRSRPTTAQAQAGSALDMRINEPPSTTTTGEQGLQGQAQQTEAQGQAQGLLQRSQGPTNPGTTTSQSTHAATRSTKRFSHSPNPAGLPENAPRVPSIPTTESPCTWNASYTPAAASAPSSGSSIPTWQFKSHQSHSPFLPQQQYHDHPFLKQCHHRPRPRNFLPSHDPRLQSVPVFPVPSRHHHRSPPAFTLLPPIRSSPHSSSSLSQAQPPSLAQQPHPQLHPQPAADQFPRPRTPGKAHHVSLPPSASKNQFVVDLSTFPFDDLDLITPDFDSRPLPDLRLSIDFGASYPSSSFTSAPDTDGERATKRPNTGIESPPHRNSLRRRQKAPVSPIAVSTPIARSRLSLTETIWPRPSKTFREVEKALGKPHKHRTAEVASSESSPHPSPSVPQDELFSPLSVAIPSKPLLDDEFLTGISFSKRGSVMLGGSRVISRSALEEYFKSTAAAEGNNNNNGGASLFKPSATQDNALSGVESCTPQSEADTASTSATRDYTLELTSSPPVTANWSWKDPPIIRKTSPTPSPSFSSVIAPRLTRDPTYDLIDVLRDQLASRAETPDTLLGEPSGHDSDTTAGELENIESDLDSPGIMAMAPSMPPAELVKAGLPDLEKESHKVRSLYEGGDALRWENGRPGNAPGVPSVSIDSVEPLEPMPEAPEEAELVHHSDTTAVGPPPTPTKRDSHRTRQEFELAGGLEDWQDVHSGDVDRYGFINPRNPDSRISTPTESRQQQMQGRTRRFLPKKENTLHSHSFLGRAPSRKISARSLNTQASEVSAISWRSTRSAARQAVNMLPVNRERRWMDEAGDMLTLAPGISDISDDVDAGRISESLKRKEWQRIEKWRSMAIIKNKGVPGQGQQYDFDMKDPKLIERTWKGIPDCWRAAAWYSFLSQSAREHGSAPSEEGIISSFHALQTKPCTDDVQIDLDVPRTISRHIMFRRRYRGGQRLLFRVLHALALYFPEVGYVQGMASLAATLLSYFDEEQAFVMLVRLWTLRGLARLYSPGFEGLMDSLRELEGIWLGGKPVAKKMAELSIDPTAYGTRWYLTLFNLSIPFGAQLRIWDVFMLLGAPAVDGPLPPPPSAIAVTPTAAPRRSAINLLPARSKTPVPASSSSSVRPPPSRSGTGTKATAGSAPPPTPSDGLQVLHAAAAALIQALSEVLMDSDFENAMKALTSWIPVKDEDMLMRVTMAEYKAHYVNRKKKRLV